MMIGVRIEPELDRLARAQGRSRRACIHQAIPENLRQDLLRHGDSAVARRRSVHLSQLKQPNRSEPEPDWNGWGDWIG